MIIYSPKIIHASSLVWIALHIAISKMPEYYKIDVFGSNSALISKWWWYSHQTWCGISSDKKMFRTYVIHCLCNTDGSISVGLYIHHTRIISSYLILDIITLWSQQIYTFLQWHHHVKRKAATAPLPSILIQAAAEMQQIHFLTMLTVLAAFAVQLFNNMANYRFLIQMSLAIH